MKRFAAASLGLLGVVLLLGAAPSCSSNDAAPKACVPGRTVKCTCVGGGQGLQTCMPDGSGYEACGFCKDKVEPGVEAGFADITGAMNLMDGAGPCLGFDDFDGDGDPDIILSRANSTQSQQSLAPSRVVIHANLGDGKFSAEPLAVLGQGFATLCTSADLDRDGLPEAIIEIDQADKPGTMYYFRNKGKFVFELDPLGFDFAPIDDSLLLALGTFDANNDGWLDIVLGRSHGGGPASGEACVMKENDFVCESTPFPGSSGPLLWLNDGTGRMKLNTSALKGPFPGTTNALAFADLDGNGLTDMFMANDWYSNHLHLQKSPGSFQRAETLLGLNLFNHGMGIGINDFDVDGNPDIYVADLGPNSLFFGKADGTFENLNAETGISAVTRYHSNWATIAEDFNLNGLADLFVASSGLVTNEEDMVKMAIVSQSPIKELVPQFDLLFWNRGDRQFAPVTLAHRGKQKPTVVLGSSATADYDGDGDLDIMVMSGDGMQFRFLQNQQPPGNYLVLDLIGTKSNPHGIGAIVDLLKGGQLVQRRYAGTGGSLGISWKSVHFGLGSATSVESLRIRWPSGTEQTLSNVEGNQTLRVTEP
ncbi:MAG: CRTAC1 family protein [Deltaproteobacteria bacterium]|nr:CRTAC1 family protein [Deltaproteobacteria bacterium]